MLSASILPRKYTRFLAGESVFARVNNDYSLVGKVKDIGLGGMAFEYISDDSICSDCIKCDIIVSNEPCCIFDLSCVIVHQSCLANTTVKGNTSIQLSRCSVSFKNINKEQQSKLNDLISNFCSL
jgi:hypothetical protein